jgi:hypothetical protein
LVSGTDEFKYPDELSLFSCSAPRKMDGHTHDPVLKCSSQDERMLRLDGGSRATFTCGVMRQS